ncbi:MAG: TIGR02597 family protein [Verrucomicrobia bacterium]|nr:TIGR02597 family protein [Verrucomicrobiota bacterium]
MGRSDVPRRDVFDEFSAWIADYRAVEGTEAAGSLIVRGELLASARRNALRELIESDPKEALARAVPEIVRRGLPSAIRKRLEERVNGRGDFRVTISCDYGEKKHMERVTREALVDGRRYAAFVYGGQRYRTSQNDIPIEGIAIDEALAIREDRGSIAAVAQRSNETEVRGQTPWAGDVGGGGGNDDRLSAADSSRTQGTKSVLFMRVAFPDELSEPITESAANAMMDQINQIFLQYSYGTTAVISDVTPLLLLPTTMAGYSTLSVDTLQNDARAAALAAGYDTDNYDFDIVRSKTISGANFNFTGRANVGGKGLMIQDSAANVALYVAVHELGHNYGLWHANSWRASGDSVIGPGSVLEYGNTFDTMGSKNFDPLSYQFGSWSKWHLQWLPSSFVQTISSSGVYRIFASDVSYLIGGQKYAFRVYKDYAREYWGEYRSRLINNSWAQNGILLNWTPFNNSVGDSLNSTVLLDTTPGTQAASGGKEDAAVVIGRTFSDVSAGIHITPIAKGVSGSDKWIDVQVNLGAFSGNNPPTLALSSDRTSVPAGASVTLTAAASDGDGDSLAYDWDFGDQTFGANSSTASKSWSAAGEYVVRCTVSDMKGGKASRNLVVTVGSPGTYRVSGLVSVNGHGLQGVRIHNGGNGSSYRGTYTDASGNFTLANLSSGSVTLSAEKYGYSLSESGFINGFSVGPDRTGANWIATQKPVLGVVAADASAAESGPETGTFTVTRSGSMSGPTTLHFTLSGGAAYSADYLLLPTPGGGSPHQLTMADGVPAMNVVLTPINDGVAEGPEKVTLTIAENPAYALGAFSEATITIADEQAPGTPTVSVTALDDAAVESGSDTGVFRFARSNVGSGDLLVNYAVGGTAISGVDYTPLIGSTVIPAGATEVEVPFTAIDDVFVEGNESVTVTVSAGTGYTPGSLSTATVTIVDDDPPTVTIAATDGTAAEPGSAGTFTVTRTGNLAPDLVVSYTMGGTAVSGLDYTALPGSVSILAGRSTASFYLSPRDDNLVEGNETAVAVLSSSPIYNVGNPGTASITISDDDVPSITLKTLSPSTVDEGSSDLGTFRFTRSGGTSGDLTVYYSISGSAFPTADYTLSGGSWTSIMIPNGSNNADLAVHPVDDMIRENNETVILMLKDSPRSEYAVSGTTPQTVTISDNDSTGPIAISFSPAADRDVEGDVFAVSVSVVSSKTITNPSEFLIFGYAVSDGTATDGPTPGGDYDFDPPELQLLGAGPTANGVKLMAFGVYDDLIPESDETIILTLSPVAHCVLDNANTVFFYTILDNDSGSGIITVSAINSSAAESGSNPGTFRISRSGSTLSTMTVNFQMAGSASSPSDYAFPGTSATIPSGSDFVDLTVTPVDDSTPETGETVVIRLTSVSEGSIGVPSSATITIVDNDQVAAAPVVGITATAATSFEPGTTTGTLTFTRTGSTAADLAVNFSVGGTASNGTDFAALGTSITIPAGADSRSITIAPLSDALVEGSETVVVALTRDAGYQIDPEASAATVTIEDGGDDFDGDGFSNLQESIAGTDPANSADRLEIVETSEGGGAFNANFTSVSGKQYRFEGADHSPSGFFGAIGSDMNGNGGLLLGTDLATAAKFKRFYRVRVLGGTQGGVLSRLSGFYRLPLLGNSDTRVSIPFSRPEAAFAVVVSTANNVMTVRGAPPWTADQWVYQAGVQTNSYYLQIRSGTLEGEYHPIIGNGVNSVTLDLEGQSLPGLRSGDRVAIVPYWTLGTIFPAGESVYASPSPGNRQTEILMPDIGGVGINLSSAGTFYFWGGNWRMVGQGLNVFNDDVVLPDMYFIVRQNLAASTILTTHGTVLTSKWRVVLMSNSSGKQDNIVALPRPVEATLNESGLIESGAFSASQFAGNRTDELLVFDSAQVAKNQSASATYYYWNGAWREVGVGATDVGNEVVFAPGTGVIIRKAAGTGSVVWSNAANY